MNVSDQPCVGAGTATATRTDRRFQQERLVRGLRILMITSEWPTERLPCAVPFIVQQAKFLRKAGSHVDVFHFRGLRNPFRYLAAWFRIRRKLHTDRYDLIHAQWGQSALLALPKNIPLVVTFRGDDLLGIVGENGHYKLLGRILQIISRRLAVVADRVIVVSERLGAQLPGLPYQVIPSGLDFELFRPIPRDEARERLALGKDKRLVLFAASPDNPRKRYDLARAALAKLPRELGAELVVATGVPRNLMPYYYGASDVLLLTSVHEGSANVLKEALACNLPVLSVDVGDAGERLGAVEGCIVTQDDSPESVASGLAEILRRRERVDGVSAVLNLDEDLLTKKVIAVYREALLSE